MKYKVGDKVRIRKDLVEDHLQAPGVTSDMIKLGGQVATIKNVNDCGYLYSVEENDYFWAEDMLELVEYKPEEVLNKLEDEIKENTDKNCKAGKMVNSGQLDQAQNDLLIAQMDAYQTVNKIIKARINLIKSQLNNKEEQENKSNDGKEAIVPFEKRYYYRLKGDDEYLTRSLRPDYLVSSKIQDRYYQTMFTDEELKDFPYDLSKFEKVLA